MTNQLNAIKSRRSIRTYRPDPVPEELIRQILQAGILAPLDLRYLFRPAGTGCLDWRPRHTVCGAGCGLHRRNAVPKTQTQP